MKNLLKKVALAAAIAGAVSAANATPVVGIANLTIGLVQISSDGTFTNIDWNNGIPGANSNPPPNGATTTVGSFDTLAAANTGSFATLGVQTSGLIRDMSENPAETGNFIPVGASVTTNFLSFGAAPGWAFTLLNFVDAGGGSPFALTQIGSTVSATLSASGTVCDTEGDFSCDLGDDVTPWVGIWSAQYTNSTIAGLAATLAAGGFLPNNTWSATIDATAVPEPGTIALLGLGLLGLAASRRRAAK